MHDGTKQLPENTKVSLKDLRLYLTTTKRQIETLLISNFHELEITLNNILQQSGRIVHERLAEYSHAVSLMNLNDIVAGLDAIRQDLKMMNKITQELRVNASELDIGNYSFLIFTHQSQVSNLFYNEIYNNDNNIILCITIIFSNSKLLIFYRCFVLILRIHVLNSFLILYYICIPSNLKS